MDTIDTLKMLRIFVDTAPLNSQGMVEPDTLNFISMRLGSIVETLEREKTLSDELRQILVR